MINADDFIAFWRRADGAYRHPDDADVPFDQYPDLKIHLHPVPWVGSIKTAKVFLLYLNPGFSKTDEQYEISNPYFVNSLKENLNGELPYIYFDKNFLDHPGHIWAIKTFGSDIYNFDTSSICIIQLVPYHSEKGHSARLLADKLPSSKLAQKFVIHTLLPRAQRGEIGLIVARASRLWGIQEADVHGNVVIYKGWQPRRALQTKNTEGGAQLRRWLTEKER